MSIFGYNAYHICATCGEKFATQQSTKRWCDVCCPPSWSRSQMSRIGLSKPAWSKLWDEQNGMCYFCDAYPECIDHDHETKLIRGLLCVKHNTQLEFIADHDWLDKALQYKDSSLDIEEMRIYVKPSIKLLLEPLIQSRRRLKICESCEFEYSITGANQRWCKVCCPTNPSHIRSLIRRFNVSKPILDEILKRQDYKCVLCENGAISLDHDHNTNAVRGVLCDRCNMKMGAVDDSAFLRRAQSYLQKYSSQSVLLEQGV